jgi:hypothetical protein
MLHSRVKARSFYGFHEAAGSGTMSGVESPSGSASTGDVTVLLAEYTSLRAEIERRRSMQWNAFALQFAATGAIAGVALSTVGNLALLLVIPVSSYLLGNRYILEDFYIELARGYLREKHGLRDRLGWERWRPARMNAMAAAGEMWVSVGWKFFHPTRMAFEGVAVLALLAMVVVATFVWVPDPPDGRVIGLSGAGWLAAVALTAALHRSFKRAGNR